MIRAEHPAAWIAGHLGCSEALVYNIKRELVQEEPIERKVGSGTTKSVRKPWLVDEVRLAIEDNPRSTIKGLARVFGVTKITMQRIINVDLGARSRAVQNRPLLTSLFTAKRLERATFMLNIMKKFMRGKFVLIFSDKKIFTTDSKVNRRNDQYITTLDLSEVPDHIKYNFTTKHPTWIMMLGVVASSGEGHASLLF